MTPTWIVYNKPWEHMVNNDIVSAIKNAGHNVIVFDRNEDRVWTHDFKGDIHTLYDNYLVLRGSIQFCNYMMREYSGLEFETNFKAGLHCNEYMNLYPYEWFLNSDCDMTTFGWLKQTGISKPTFIRPNSPFKSFTGFTLTPENFKHEINSLNQISHVKDDEIILRSSAKNIKAEFRCVIAGRKVIEYSEYKWEDTLDVRRDIFPECLEFAEQVAQYKNQLDEIYVVDIAQTDNGPKIVEFNSFCSSGLYACDLNNLVDGVGKFLLDKHQGRI